MTEDLLYRRGNFTGTFDQLILDALRETQDTEIALSPGFRWGVSVLPGEPITLEQAYTQTAITYPQVTVREMSGERLKFVLEDVADNLFNPDPYYQQGGDMVRVGGLTYAIDPTASTGKRISEMAVDGKPIEPGKTYKVASWAPVNPVDEALPPVYEVFADWLRSRKTVRAGKPNVPVIKGIRNNPGLDLAMLGV